MQAADYIRPVPAATLLTSCCHFGAMVMGTDISFPVGLRALIYTNFVPLFPSIILSLTRCLAHCGPALICMVFGLFMSSPSSPLPLSLSLSPLPSPHAPSLSLSPHPLSGYLCVMTWLIGVDLQVVHGIGKTSRSNTGSKIRGKFTV